MVGKNIRNYIQYFLFFLLLLAFFNRIFLACILILCVFVYLSCICCTLCVFFVSYVFCCILCVFDVPYVYLLYYVCMAILTLDSGLLSRTQYPEGPAAGHLDTGFSWFPCVYKRMLRWFPSFQVAATCHSCSPPD